MASSYASNNEHTVATSAGQFLLVQRNSGFGEHDDGRWLVHQFPEPYWSAGILQHRRSGFFLGVFDTREDALSAIDAMKLQPIKDEEVKSIGYTY